MPRPTIPQDSEPRGWAAHGWLYFNTDPFDKGHYFNHRVRDAVLDLRDEAIAKYGDRAARWFTFDLALPVAKSRVMDKERDCPTVGRPSCDSEFHVIGCVFEDDGSYWFNYYWSEAQSRRLYNVAIEYLRGEQ
jgi:hypothetical protein